MQTELQAEGERHSSLQLSHAGSGHLDSGGGAGGGEGGAGGLEPSWAGVQEEYWEEGST